MPIYEYRCRSCEKVFEALRPMGDDGKKVECPKCGTLSPEKIFSVFSASSGTGSGEAACEGRGRGGGGCGRGSFT